MTKPRRSTQAERDFADRVLDETEERRDNERAWLEEDAAQRDRGEPEDRTQRRHG
jgi:hypothetical protein